jgi:hypothetical protein
VAILLSVICRNAQEAVLETFGGVTEQCLEGEEPEQGRHERVGGEDGPVQPGHGQQRFLVDALLGGSRWEARTWRGWPTRSAAPTEEMPRI